MYDSLTQAVPVSQGYCSDCKKEAPEYYKLCMEGVLRMPDADKENVFLCEIRSDLFLFAGNIYQKLELYQGKLRDFLIQNGESDRDSIRAELRITQKQWDTIVKKMPDLQRRRSNNRVLYSIGGNHD